MHASRVRIGLTALFTATALVGIAACSSGSGSSADDKKGPLEVWVRAADDSLDSYQLLFDTFKEQDGVDIKVFATLTDFETKLTAAAASHDLPDVVIDDAAQLGNFETQGILQTVDKAKITGNDQVNPAAWQSVTDVDGKTMGIPFSAQANLLFIRTDWLKNLGLDVPKTWDDFVKVAKAFTNDDPDGNGKNDTYGVGIPGSTQRGYISWNWSTYLWQNGGDYVTGSGSDVTSAIGSPQAVEAAQWYEDLICKDKVAQPGALNAITTDTNEAWQTGVVGMYLTGPYAIPTSDGTAVKGKYTVVAPPAGPANAQTLAEGTSIYLMAGSKKTALAERFASFMITADSQKTGMVGNPKAAIVRLPINTQVDTAAVHDGDERWKTAQDVYSSSAHYEPISLPQWQAMRQAASDTLNKTISQCGDPAPALAALDAQYADLLKG